MNLQVALVQLPVNKERALHQVIVGEAAVGQLDAVVLPLAGVVAGSVVPLAGVVTLAGVVEPDGAENELLRISIFLHKQQ